MILVRTLRTKCALLAVVCGLAMGVASEAAAQQINVAWDPSGGTVGYRVHVGQQSGSYSQHFDVGSATSFTYSNATAGQRFCFAVSAYLLSSSVEGPNSAEVCGYSNAPPTLQNPGPRTSVVGQPTSLQLVGSDPQQPLTYSATGLPPGLSVQSSTGYISGTGTTAGTYNVTARANDGTLTATQQFTWTMTSSTGGGGGGNGDTTRPVATITSPTSNSSYTASGSSMNLGGTASDNVGVTQVRWTSDRGFNGTAAGTSNWSVSGIPLQNGTNVITVTAFDNAGNSGVDTVTVTYFGTGGGSTGGSTTGPPTIAITSPTSGDTFATSSSSIIVGGTAGGAVTRVMWSNDQTGALGMASGTTNWSISIPLASGTNYITVRSYDAAGNQSAGDFLTITRGTTTTTPPPPTGGGGDTTRPVAAITTPTLNSWYTASGSSMNLGGTATDNVGVTQVRWSSDRGGNGVASGTTTWSASGIPLQNGTNVITVTAFDAAGNSGVDTVTVTYSGTSGGWTGGGSTGPDTTRPTIAISSPTAGESLTTSSSSITVGGTAADDVGVTRVMWSNDRTGALGVASGTTNWSISIPLGSGTNYITVRSYDAAGNQSAGDFLTVYR